MKINIYKSSIISLTLDTRKKTIIIRKYSYKFVHHENKHLQIVKRNNSTTTNTINDNYNLSIKKYAVYNAVFLIGILNIK